ncbi:MAG: NAD(P)-dependent oxidoreductase [Blastochloris sp.]|nr:NAD(P)-dependent oxidoreductase [Blastochloris sp.]
MKPQLCLIGYGIIGQAWHQHYLQDGYEVRVWNRSPKPGVPGYLSDLAQAASESEILHLVVADPPAVQEVLATVRPVLKPGMLVMQSSTISPEWAGRFKIWSGPRAPSMWRLRSQAARSQRRHGRTSFISAEKPRPWSVPPLTSSVWPSASILSARWNRPPPSSCP